MPPDLEISLLGELRVMSGGSGVVLPASRKARALLAFLVATGRPHRRERLCELFWNLPDDPRAALRWSLSKLRRVVDAPGRICIVADRERVYFDAEGVGIDIRDIHARLRTETLSVEDLEQMARRLEMMLLDGLDGSGGDSFDAWLATEREDAEVARVSVLRRLATHPDVGSMSAQKWRRLWHVADPLGRDRSKPVSQPPALASQGKAGAGEGSGGSRGRPRKPAPGVARVRGLRSQRI